MTLRQWLRKFHTTPQMIVALFLFSLWLIFAGLSFYSIEAKHVSYVKQTSDHLSVAFSQNNRVIAESVLETLLSQGGAVGAEVCNGDRQEISANQTLNACKNKSTLLERIIEQNVTGSGTQILRARFSLINDVIPLLPSLGWSLLFVFMGFYFIQSTKDKIKKDIFEPLIKNLLGDEPLEIKELNDLRAKIKVASELEAEKAVTLAIKENNQQVAHDIRSPIAAIGALVEMMELPDSPLKHALDKALIRANSVANFLLHSELKQTEVKEEPIYNVAQIVKDIVTEKTPLFKGGTISVSAAESLLVESKLSSASLARILSNVIDNSMLACETRKEIHVDVLNSKDFIEIKVKDSGVGISQEVIDKVGQKGFSSRNSGNGCGRGVFSAIKTLEEIDGEFSIRSTVGLGTTVKLKFPIQEKANSTKIDFVYVDDEELHRTTWEIWSLKNGFNNKTYSSVEHLLNEKNILQKDIPLFLDSNLGTNNKGEDWAEKLAEIGFKEIFLATSNSASAIKHNRSIKGILGKNPNELKKILHGRESNLSVL